MPKTQTATEVSLEEWLAIRKKEGLKIDPSTAEVDWHYAQIFDPYGVNPDLPKEYDYIGRAYFARRPGSEVWVCFDDIPEEIRNALWERYEAGLAIPEDLF